MVRLKWLMCALLCVLGAVACGGDNDGDGDNSSNNTKTLSGPFSCAGDYGECDDAATQYCIVSKQGSINLASSCITYTSSCRSCDCLDVESDWLKNNDDSNNCTGAVITCASSSDAPPSVICQK